MLTAKSRDEEIIEGFQAGANDYLVKPFTGDELMARIDIHLRVGRSYQTLKENIQLKKELDLRKQTEQDLHFTQNRLSGMLNSIDRAMVGVNEAGEISFSNEPFARFIDIPADSLLGTPFIDLLNQSSHQTVRELLENQMIATRTSSQSKSSLHVVLKGKEILNVELDWVLLELEEERLLVFVVKEQELPDGAFHLIETLNNNRLMLRELEESLNGMTPIILEKHPEFITTLRHVDQSLNHIQVACDKDRKENGSRTLIVQVMNLALHCWQQETKSSKADLAKQSGLWKVYMTKDGYERTQTFDRYLDLATLPKIPRRKQVIQTAQFVLEICKDNNSSCHELSTALSTLQAM